MKTTRVYIFLVLLSFEVYAQRITGQYMPLPLKCDELIQSDTNRQIMAVFATMNRIGTVPFSVQFKDMSSGQPTRWMWVFGDGKTDSVKNPLHVYEKSGVYTVKLTITRGNETSSITRHNYILVGDPEAIDTLGYPLAGSYVLYIIQQNGSGYVSGNNSFGDLAKASFFNSPQSPVNLVGGIFDFAVARKSLASDLPVTFKVWKGNGPGQSPGTVITEQSIPISQIVLEAGYQWSTPVFFNPPPVIDEPFFLGVELPQQFGDTLALFTNAHGDVAVGNGWEQHSNGLWYPYSDPHYSWNIQIDHAIYPLLSYNTGIKNHQLINEILVYPLPAHDQLFIKVLNPGLMVRKIRLFTAHGKEVIQTTPPACTMQATLDLDSLLSGIYFLQLETDKGTWGTKVIVNK